MLLCAQTQLALQLCTAVGDVLGLLLVFGDVEGVARLTSTCKSKQQHGLRRTCRHNLLVTLVVHSTDAAADGSCHHGVALADGAILDKDFGHIAAAFVQRALDDCTLCALVGIAFQLHNVGLQDDFFKQFVDIDALLGTDILALVLTAPFFNQQVHIGKLGLDAVGIGTRLIYLVDGEDNRDTGCLCVVDSLYCLRHYLVIGSNNDDGNICHLGTAGTHSGKCLVARGVEECDLASVGSGHLVGTDMLGNTAGFACDNVGLADIVKQRRLTVVNVTHNGDDGVARHQVFGLVFFLNLVQRVDNLRAGKADFIAKLIGDKTDGLCVKALVDADEDANLHTGSDNLRYGDVHHCGQLVGGDELRHLQRLLVLHLAQLLLLNLLVNLLAFLAVVLRSLRLTHRAQSCQSLFNLLFDLGVVHLRFLLLSGFFLFLALLVLAFGLLLGGIGLLDCLRVILVDLYALFLDAFAFLLFLIVAAFGLGLVKLGQVDFRHNLRTFELLVLGLDELDFLLWSLLRGFLDGLGLRNRGCDRLLHSFFFCGGNLLLLGFRSLGFLLIALFLFFGLAVLLLGLALFCRAHTGVDGRKVNLVHYAHLCVKGVLALFGTSHRAAQHLGLELGRCRFRLGFGLCLRGSDLLSRLFLLGIRVCFGLLLLLGSLFDFRSVEILDNYLVAILRSILRVCVGGLYGHAAGRGDFNAVGVLFHLAFSLERRGQQSILLRGEPCVWVGIYHVALLGKVFHEGRNADVQFFGGFVESDVFGFF